MPLMYCCTCDTTTMISGTSEVLQASHVNLEPNTRTRCMLSEVNEAGEGEPVEDPDPDLDCTSLPLSFDPAPFTSAFQVASTLIDWWGQFGDLDFSAESSTAAVQKSSATVSVQSPSSVPASATTSAQDTSCVSTTTRYVYPLPPNCRFSR